MKRGYFYDMEGNQPTEAERAGKGGKVEPCRMIPFAVPEQMRHQGESAALSSLAGALPLTALAGVSREALQV